MKCVSLQYKALLTLIVFSLNTVTGFACSVGVDMGFNSSHHNRKPVVSIHLHADWKKHQHEKSHHTNHKQNDHQKEDCCNSTVVKILQADKPVPKADIVLHQAYFPVFTPAYYYAGIELFTATVIDTRYFFRNYHPPIADIRIVIQSLLI